MLRRILSLRWDVSSGTWLLYLFTKLFPLRTYRPILTGLYARSYFLRMSKTYSDSHPRPI